MDPLSISASIAGLIGLAAGLVKLAQGIRATLKDDVAQLVYTVSVDVELFNGALSHIKAWTDDNGYDEKHRKTVLNMLPFINSSTTAIRKIGENLMALEIVAKKRGIRKLYSAASLDEKLKALEAARRDLECVKSNLLLALSARGQDNVSNSLHEITKKLDEISIAISKPGDGVARLDEYIIPQSFDTWLESFATNSSTKTELQAYKMKKARQQALQVTGDSIDAHADKIYVKVDNLKDQNGDLVSETLCLDKNTEISDALAQLRNRGKFIIDIEYDHEANGERIVGYENISGFQTTDGKHKFGSLEMNNEPVVIQVTTGLSCYDLKFGLRINENERLIDFYDEFLDQSRASPRQLDIESTEEHSTGLIVRGRDMERVLIRLNRTSRLTEDGLHTEIQDFGEFPLQKVSDFKTKMPAAMVQKGGYFFPMFQREAVGIGFEEPSHNPQSRMEEILAIKVFIGSVNAVTKKPPSSLSETVEQDFIIAPKQGRLDGVKIGEGVLQQFVAMPLGWDYTIEKQVTNSEFIGGIQLQIAPKYRTDVRFFDAYNFSKSMETPDECLDMFKTPRELDLQKLFMDISSYFDHEIKDSNRVHETYLTQLPNGKSINYTVGTDHFRIRFVHEMETHRDEIVQSSAGDPLVIHPIDSISFTIKIQTIGGAWSDEVYAMSFSPFCHLNDFMRTIRQEFIYPGGYNIYSIRINDRLAADDPESLQSEQIYVPLSDVFPDGGVVCIIPPFPFPSSYTWSQYPRSACRFCLLRKIRVRILLVPKVTRFD
ncbi:hypothetical protein H072_6242 [Dactylellina haptotyla CBS 200.50]|uniref:Fungal N-terminal domain-containing protein n=1 Tax=Dactylellina haptotyla (strain CBS 200.50) TaxID=1284197 RepID=S8BKN6_DACHA|nr:hypothetical protein H072_6242 [Dactylellina haptotyla CBS 200.50]